MLTRLDPDSGSTRTSILLPSQPTPRNSLNPECSLLSPHILRQSLGQNNPPPTLDLDGLDLEIPEPPQINPSPDILLDDSNELVESGGSETFENS